MWCFSWATTTSIKTRKAFTVKSQDWAQTVHTLQQSWTKAFPESSFDYFFLDDFIDQQYRADLAFGRLVGIFCFLAIGIACLGLLGLASYDTLLRRKEVGVRKVLGATVPQLIKLLSRDLVILVIAAYAISVPVFYFVASTWLESYSFRMTMNPWMFIIPLVILLPIAFLTVSSQTIKVASSNPVDSLRSEWYSWW
jgi:putative ABC transport system permease protein